MRRAKRNAFLSPAQTLRVETHLSARAAEGGLQLSDALAVIFVEGETERIVLRTQTAVEQEGICVLDFGQIGLESLLRSADAHDCPWHVLVDGDEAGAHYANTARRSLRRRSPASHITVSDHSTFEHALWESGYREALLAVAREHGVELQNDSLDAMLRAARLKLPKPLLVETAIRRARACDANLELPSKMRAAILAVRKLATQSSG